MTLVVCIPGKSFSNIFLENISDKSNENYK